MPGKPGGIVHKQIIHKDRNFASCLGLFGYLMEIHEVLSMFKYLQAKQVKRERELIWQNFDYLGFRHSRYGSLKDFINKIKSRLRIKTISWSLWNGNKRKGVGKQITNLITTDLLIWNGLKFTAKCKHILRLNFLLSVLRFLLIALQAVYVSPKVFHVILTLFISE